ncbi:MAG: hypothetical protein LQ340_000358 [Diploschistes diacapsis]|nr:MAG: hypothetical protein LQ340_000358 [Diploschistes diacapsis]
MEFEVEAPTNSVDMASDDIEIFAGGDVVVTCGSRRMLVSSHTLSNSSPTLQALLRPGFREGNFERSAASPLPLDLPEDNEVAMEMLLKLMHFSPDVCSGSRDTGKEQNPYGRLRQLAILADKYCCTPVVYHLCDTWMNSLAAVDNTMQELDDLTHVAFLTRNDQRFSTFVTRMLSFRESSDLQHVSSLCLRGKNTKHSYYEKLTLMASIVVREKVGSGRTMRKVGQGS